MRSVRGCPAIALVAFVAGCSAARPVQPLRARAAPPAGSAVSAAVFRYHPHAAAPMLASVELEDGRVLFAGKRGERWLFEPSSSALEAALPAGEELLAIASDAEQGLWFVGKSGTSYRARTPLGPFVDANLPLAPLARVSASGRALLGVGRDQRLTRSDDDGRTWSPVGPEGTAFVDVAVDARGRALALATPEALWESDDGGRNFRPNEAPPSGVLSLTADPSGDGVRITSVLGASRWGAAEPNAVKPALSLEELLRRGASVPLGPDAGALAGHAACFCGPGYVEARQLAEGKREWSLVSGPLGGPLKARPLTEAKGCAAVSMAGFGGFVSFACFASPLALSQQAQLFASEDGGASFRRVAPDFWAKPASFRMAVGSGGRLLISGACPPSVQGQGCARAGVLYRRPVVEGAQKSTKPSAKPDEPRARTSQESAPEPEAGFELAVAAVPSLADSALIELAFDADGQRAFALSGSTKGSTLSLFVSEDGGRHFEGHDLGDVAREQDLEAGVPLTPGRDGTLALVLGARRGTPGVVVVDAEGRVLRVSSPPERALLAAVGPAILAIGAENGNVHESLDGGASWEARGKLPFPPCPGDGSCDVPVRCSNDGCVVGDELTRVGFGAGDDLALDVSAPGEPRGNLSAVMRGLGVQTPMLPLDGAGNGLERRLRTPLACTLLPAAWRVLPGVDEFPDADQAAIGDTAWFAVAEDSKTGEVRAFHAKGGSKPRVDAVELLPRLAKPEGFAQFVTFQIEGAAAVRYRVPEARPNGAKLHDVEVAWDNLFENRVGRARVADAGLYTPGDFEQGTGGVQSARPDLVSIAERGIYLRVHASTRTDQPTLFLDGSSTVSLPSIAWPSAIPRAGHAEMGHLGAEHVGLMLMSRGGALARARLDGGRWLFDAAGVGLPDPEAFGVVQLVNITYASGAAALHVEELDERGRGARARLFPLRAQGPVIGSASPVPTELDLPAQPNPCSAEERAKTARLLARGYPGARHPVVVSDAIEPPRSLLTGDAVLYGSRASPCAAAFELHTVPGGGADASGPERGIVLLGDLEHAWLFRSARSPGSDAAHVEYRTMSCRFDPALELPQEILDAPEAFAPKR